MRRTWRRFLRSPFGAALSVVGWVGSAIAWALDWRDLQAVGVPLNVVFMGLSGLFALMAASIMLDQRGRLQKARDAAEVTRHRYQARLKTERQKQDDVQRRIELKNVVADAASRGASIAEETMFTSDVQQWASEVHRFIADNFGIGEATLFLDDEGLSNRQFATFGLHWRDASFVWHRYERLQDLLKRIDAIPLLPVLPSGMRDLDAVNRAMKRAHR